MDSKPPSSELDEPIEAIVVDDGSRRGLSRGEMWQARLAEHQVEPCTVVPTVSDVYPAKSFVETAQYVVPRRFGMSAILGIMTALAVLFGMFRMSNVPPVLYLFFGVEAIVICIAQMLWGKTPRAASAIAGSVLLPLFLIAGAVYFEGRWRRDIEGVACVVMACVPLGAFLGYMTGTLAAGVFLVMDAAERLLMFVDSAPAGNRRA